MLADGAMMPRMFSPFLARVSVLLGLLMLGCGGPQGPQGKGAGSAISADAPSWARAGDSKSREGSLFVCEGEGPDEQQAVDAARALCSAKICALCGVEVKATLETRETLQQVEVERKVVETCRRVRKSEEQVVRRQTGCGPSGCTAWLQVFFGAEDEARECRAYADGDFADSAQCEALIDQFRATRGLSSELFRVRADILSRAVIACADIDVRPTPKLTALDEILRQGVVDIEVEQPPLPSVDKSRSIAERLRAQAENAAESARRRHTQYAYRAVAFQPVRETKVFVDRIAMLRDAMSAYASIMVVAEALARAQHLPDAESAAALVKALKGVKGVEQVWTPDALIAWALNDLTLFSATLRQPELQAYLMERYLVAPKSTGEVLLRAMTSDAQVSEAEWRFVMDNMRDCPRCATTLLEVADHGGEAKRVARLTELSQRTTTDAQVALLQELPPDLLLRAEPSLAPSLAPRIFTYKWHRRWLEQVPALGSDAVSELIASHSARGWKLSAAQRKAMAKRAGELLRAELESLRCDSLDSELNLLERHGVATRELTPKLCQCVSEPRHSGMRDVVKLYQRLVAWGASCVAKEGT